MIYLEYIVKLVLYLVFIAMFFLISKYKFSSLFMRVNTFGHVYKNNKKLGFYLIFLVSLLFGIYSVYVSKFPYVKDRGNYAYRFVGDYPDYWTTGLRVIVDFLHIFTHDPKWLFFTVTFLSVLLFLIVYCWEDNATWKTLVLLVSSSSLVYSFYLLKQVLSIVFCALALTAFLKKRWFLTIVFTFMAILFHESAIIIIPFMVMLLFAKKRWMRMLFAITSVICICSFSNMTRIGIQLLGKIFPVIIAEISRYLDDTGGIAISSNIMTVFKGFPYYIITIYGFIKRPELKNRIKNYDELLMISMFGSFTILMSYYMYWMWRLGAFCYFHIFLFVDQLSTYSKKTREGQMFFVIVFFSLSFLTLRYLAMILFNAGGF